MIEVLLIVCALSYVLFCCTIIKRDGEKIVITIDNVIILTFAVYFGVVFPTVFLFAPNNAESTFFANIRSFEYWDILIYYSFLSAFLLVLAKTVRRFLGRRPQLISDDATDGSASDRVFLMATIILLIIGVISDRLYLNAYGGYINYLKYSALIRNGITDTIKNPFSFLIAFRDCVIVAAYFLYAMLDCRAGKIKKRNLPLTILFIIAFVYSAFILYANKGRVSLIIFFLVFLVSKAIIKRNTHMITPKTALHVLVLSAFSVAAFGLLNLFLFRKTSTNNVIYQLFEEISFPFSNFKMAISKFRLEDCRWFLDIIIMPVFVLPSSLWRAFFPQTSSDLMTIATLGHQKGEGNVFGEIPIDVISLSYLEGHILGVIIVPAVFGLMIAVCYRTFRKIKNARIRAVLITYFTLDIVLRSIAYGDPYNVVQRLFPLIVFFLIYSVLKRIILSRQVSGLSKESGGS